MLYQKNVIVEAREYEGPKLLVVSNQYGEQLANAGDYLVGSGRGHVHVVSKAQFEAEYQPYTAPADPEAPVPAIFRKEADGTFIAIEPSSVTPGEEIYNQHPDGSYSLVVEPAQ